MSAECDKKMKVWKAYLDMIINNIFFESKPIHQIFCYMLLLERDKLIISVLTLSKMIPIPLKSNLFKSIASSSAVICDGLPYLHESNRQRLR